MATKTNGTDKSNHQAIIDEVLALQQKLADKRQLAIEAMLAQMSDLREQLASLGYEVTIQVGQGRTGKRGGARAASKGSSERICPVCKVPGHDLRNAMHKAQGKNKK